MTTTAEMETTIEQLEFTDLIALQARVTELVQQRRSEVMARLEKEAELVGATIVDGNGKKPRGRKAKPKREE